MTMTDAIYGAPVEVSVERPLRLSADCMRALEKATGRTMAELTGEGADQADQVQLLAFAELYRRYRASGHMPTPAELWEQAGAIDLDFVPVRPLDPTAGESTTASPPSAATGA